MHCERLVAQKGTVSPGGSEPRGGLGESERLCCDGGQPSRWRHGGFSSSAQVTLCAALCPSRFDSMTANRATAGLKDRMEQVHGTLSPTGSPDTGHPYCHLWSLQGLRGAESLHLPRAQRVPCISKVLSTSLNRGEGHRYVWVEMISWR